MSGTTNGGLNGEHVPLVGTIIQPKPTISMQKMYENILEGFHKTAGNGAAIAFTDPGGFMAQAIMINRMDTMLDKLERIAVALEAQNAHAGVEVAS